MSLLETSNAGDWWPLPAQSKNKQKNENVTIRRQTSHRKRCHREHKEDCGRKNVPEPHDQRGSRHTSGKQNRRLAGYGDSQSRPRAPMHRSRASVNPPRGSTAEDSQANGQQSIRGEERA